jgi:hypothetical protein
LGLSVELYQNETHVDVLPSPPLVMMPMSGAGGIGAVITTGTAAAIVVKAATTAAI